MLQEAKTLIQNAWRNRELLIEDDTKQAIEKIIKLLDKGEVRVAEPTCAGEWLVNEWIKKAVALYFLITQSEIIDADPFTYFDKIRFKTDFKEGDVRAVPNTLARYGSFIDKGVVLMPSFVNIGAHIEKGSFVDTWSTIGSCAQIGKNVHIGGHVEIGGVLEPPQAEPVIIENDCFIGSGCRLLEGTFIQNGSILSCNVLVTASSRIIDVTGDQPVEYNGVIPPYSVVVPGSYTKNFNAGNFNLPCALIIGKRDETSDLDTSLKEAVKKFKIEV